MSRVAVFFFFARRANTQDLQLPAGRQDDSIHSLSLSSTHSRPLHSRRVKRAIILVNSEQLAVIKHRKSSQLGTQLFLNKIPPDCFVGLGTAVIINPGVLQIVRQITHRTRLRAARRLLG